MAIIPKISVQHLKKIVLASWLLLAVGAHAADDLQSCGVLQNQQFTRLHDVVSDNLCERFQGQVLLIVNTASQCGFTPQLEGLEALYQHYRDKGFAVLGFPSNDFYQERKSEAEIASFCKENYGVTFPMYQKSSVRGNDANPLYQQLAAQTGDAPKWNFFKYLVDRQGRAVALFSSRTTPEDAALRQQIEALLAP